MLTAILVLQLLTLAALVWVLRPLVKIAAPLLALHGFGLLVKQLSRPVNPPQETSRTVIHPKSDVAKRTN